MFRSQLQTWVYFTPKHSSRSLTRIQYLRFFYFRQNVLKNKMSWSSVNRSLSYTRVTHILSETKNWPSLQKIPSCPSSVKPHTCSDFFSPQMTFVYFATLYKWDHTARTFLCLASFWQRNAFDTWPGSIPLCWCWYCIARIRWSWFIPSPIDRHLFAGSGYCESKCHEFL